MKMFRANALTRDNWHMKLTEIARELDKGLYAQHCPRQTGQQKRACTLGTKEPQTTTKRSSYGTLSRAFNSLKTKRICFI
jgi:hypothetical protein